MASSLAASRRLFTVQLRYASSHGQPAPENIRSGLFERAGNFVGRALRETGQALDRLGCNLQGNMAYKEQLNRTRRIMPLGNMKPHLAPGVFVAPNATVIGNVTIGQSSSVWYSTVLRGDVNFIKIGSYSYIGDGVVIHVVRSSMQEVPLPAEIEDNVIVESGCVIHGCKLRYGCFIDMGATVYDGAEVGKASIVEPGSLVTPGTVIPEEQVWGGSPARYIRDVTREDFEKIEKKREVYAGLAKMHQEEHARPEWDRQRERDVIHFEEIPIAERKMKREQESKPYEP